MNYLPRQISGLGEIIVRHLEFGDTVVFFFGGPYELVDFRFLVSDFQLGCGEFYPSDLIPWSAADLPMDLI